MNATVAGAVLELVARKDVVVVVVVVTRTLVEKESGCVVVVLVVVVVRGTVRADDVAGVIVTVVT